LFVVVIVQCFYEGLAFLLEEDFVIFGLWRGLELLFWGLGFDDWVCLSLVLVDVGFDLEVI
jgi:hypothetical protein